MKVGRRFDQALSILLVSAVGLGLRLCVMEAFLVKIYRLSIGTLASVSVHRVAVSPGQYPGATLPASVFSGLRRSSQDVPVLLP